LTADDIIRLQHRSDVYARHS